MTSEKIPSSSLDTRAQILAEHRQIGELVRRIANTRDLAELDAGLQQLQPLFERHFAREESLDGLHRDIRERAPQHTTALDELKQDHRELLAQAAELRARVKACLEGPVQDIRTLCQKLLEDLRNHEARENDVFLDSVWTDLGQGD